MQPDSSQMRVLRLAPQIYATGELFVWDRVRQLIVFSRPGTRATRLREMAEDL